MLGDEKLKLFVPGRLCLFGEHSDWAGMYRTLNAGIAKGAAIVSGIEQGIYATAEKSDRFIMCSPAGTDEGQSWECDMDSAKLLEVARQGGFFSYVAGVASYINDNYKVGGIKVTVTEQDLPIKDGLSSSAAICVLAARAFNQLYHLNMSIKGEMQAAYMGEQRTPSRCGRMDQACAYGVKPVLMEFDGSEVSSKVLHIGGTFHWVIANLMASKDTIRILSELNKAFPFAKDASEQKVQEALGSDNRRIVNEAIRFLEAGNAVELGALMDRAQYLFDKKVMPACDELKAPVLHKVLTDQNIRRWIYGAKGVGSQGDGSVQFLAKSEADAELLQAYLKEKMSMPSMRLTIKPGQSVKKAIIPLAGFGTRVFPATKCVRKCFMPVLDTDGLLKPALLIMLEQLREAGIEDIALVIGEDEQEEFDRFFMPLDNDRRSGLSEDKLSCEDKICELGSHITYVFQNERKGFGHAVWSAKQFADGEPVLLLLGDFLYQSYINDNCCRQMIDAYKECGRTLVGIKEIPLERAGHYGLLHGIWDEDGKLMKADRMVEKPTNEYAEEYLGVPDTRGERKYYATFGQYVITPDVFEELEQEISEDKPSEGREFGLTAALDQAAKRNGIFGFVPDGQSYDIGLPETYRETICRFYK